MRTQAVIFDLDGLIVDSEPVHRRAFHILLKRHGIAYEFDVAEYGQCFVGIPVKDNMDYLKTRFGLTASPEELLRDREAIYEALLTEPANLVPMPGVFAVMDHLQARGLPLAVATGSPRSQGEIILRGLGIAPRLRAFVAGSDVPRTKPAPDVYVRAAAELGVAPAQCLALEDSATGVTAARAAGMRVIAVPNQYTAAQDLAHADARVECLADALRYVD